MNIMNSVSYRNPKRPGTDLKSIPRGSVRIFGVRVKIQPAAGIAGIFRSNFTLTPNILVLLLWAGSAAAQQAPASGPYCPVVFQIPDRPVVDVDLEEGDTYVNADRIDLIEQGVSQLEGSVEMTTDTWSAQADEATYSDTGNFVDLSGDVKFWEESLFLDGDRAHIDLNDNTTRVNAARYYIPDSDAWGEAEELFIDPGTLTSGKNMAFTTCAPENGGGIEENFWGISARELNLDHETGTSC